ncbi:MAG: inorganic phosphate transporter [Flavobacteriales bacterium]|nr:inorganic phosphate transporter [Flavobacteriales bacterium]
MDTYYLIIVICLIVLAVSDLMVGVSNDAVNFLNSAFGSKVANRRTILIVATIGIGLGAMSSSGMMEIARKGIFNPEMFTFADIMIIFLAVMITDILLLDLFNTFGMPTSTTVSIMFELLGAAFMVACIKIMADGGSFSTLGEYLNTSNAILIIAGIFLSVLIAFSLGTMVQYLTRLVFSFNLDQSLKRYGAVFGGIAITTITYFLLIKGMKGSSFINPETAKWMKQNTLILLGIIFTFWTAVCYLLTFAFKVNVLKVVVLSGTFSLAMAFAGNDLVNFIGVPLAGLQSYEIYGASGTEANELGMAVLGSKLQTNSWILLAAGVIMILTLWFSKKARSVTETEINLARQSVGAERFKSNLLSRMIVRFGIGIGKTGNKIMGDSVRNKVDRRFQQNKSQLAMAKEAPAFDLVRASVNLMMASVLIAFATSLKLPLSTTYVSFMVAMGTSLADRAWDRDSAVYRVSGVINVISGWLFTALVAFTSAAVLAIVLHFGGMIAVVALMGLTVFLLVRSQIIHKRREKKKNTSLSQLMDRDQISSTEVFRESEQRISTTLFKVGYILKDAIRGLSSEERKVILRAKTEIENYQKEHEDLTASFYYYLKKIDSESPAEGQFYLHVLDFLQDLSQSVTLIGNKVFEHVNNLHKPMQKEKLDELSHLAEELALLFNKIADVMDKEEKGNLMGIEESSNEILLIIDQLEKAHIARVKGEKSSPKNSMLYISILLECKDILDSFKGLVDLYEKDENPGPKVPPKDTLSPVYS